MKLFLRTRRLVAANLHDLFDRLQSPEQLARHAVRELAAAIDRATSALARSLVAERLLQRRREKQRKQLDQWNQRAREAACSGDDAAARLALGRAFDSGGRVVQFDRQLAEIGQINAELRRRLVALRDRYQQSGEQLSLHAARQAVAAAAREFITAGATATPAFDGLEQLLDQVERGALQAEVELELERDLDPANDDAAEDRTRQQFIEQELERLRT